MKELIARNQVLARDLETATNQVRDSTQESKRILRNTQGKAARWNKSAEKASEEVQAAPELQAQGTGSQAAPETPEAPEAGSEPAEGSPGFSEGECVQVAHEQAIPSVFDKKAKLGELAATQPWDAQYRRERVNQFQDAFMPGLF